MGGMSSVTLTLIGKPGCHLCDDARAAIQDVVTSAAIAGTGVEVSIEERNILEDAELHAKHVEEIPVVLVDGKMHTYWRVDADRLTAAILKASAA